MGSKQSGTEAGRRSGRRTGVERGKLGCSAREVLHDLRQPMAAVAALVNVAEMNPALPDDVRRNLEQINGELRVMVQLCGRLLDDVPAKTARVRLDEVAKEAASSASLAFDRPIAMDAAAVEVVGDELALRRASQNLLENACRAAGPKGTVRIIVRNAPEGAHLEVHDNGPGFGAGAPGAASLGLNIVHLVARDHGGHLEVGESDLGGARVAIVLPAALHEDYRDALETTTDRTEREGERSAS